MVSNGVFPSPAEAVALRELRRLVARMRPQVAPHEQPASSGPGGLELHPSAGARRLHGRVEDLHDHEVELEG
jgi:hypothetical protein